MTQLVPRIKDDCLTPLFLAVQDAVEESVYNSLFMANTVDGYKGRVDELDVNKTVELLKKHLHSLQQS